MITINKSFYTETAHIVRDAVSQRCKYNIHGHSYKWVVHVGGFDLNNAGMVMDFKELRPIRELIDKFDHSCVFWSKQKGHILDFFTTNFKRTIIMKYNPTAQNMAKLMFRASQQLIEKYNNEHNTQLFIQKVEVWETKDSCATAIENQDYEGLSVSDLVTLHLDES